MAPPVRVMGIVNVTPDSFSGDGTLSTGEGREAGIAAALEQGESMAAAGADLLDVGGESTRPGYTPVAVEEELARVVPVVERLAGRGHLVSIDTTKPAVAEAALAAGARMVNDVWGLRRAPELAGLAATWDADLVLVHNQQGHEYPGDLVAEIIDSLRRSIAVAVDAGLSRRRLWVDPGIGFGKTAAQNVEVLRRLEELQVLELPVLVAASRKGFLERVFGQPLERRVWGTAAVVTAAVLRGAAMVRVHDVAEMVDVVRVAEGLRA
ncbi:MAG: dihydropteroate synthase [Candidatus Dormibacteraeota bacterium]|nr:dihydropteroate synthase [Candidatus Dormibacteraeota bacterium]